MYDQILKDKIFSLLIHCQISTFTSLYAPDEAVVTISNICQLLPNATKYGVRQALKALIRDGVICFKSQGCPAIMSYGEIPELVCDAAPPINGYALSEKGYQTPEYKTAYKEWEDSMKDWAEGRLAEDAGRNE